MPFGMGPYYVKSQFWGGFGFMPILGLIILVVLIVMLFVLFRQNNSESQQIKEEIIKLQKDIEELKELVKDLKKKWEEIE